MAGSTPPPVSGNAPAPLEDTDPRRLGVYEVLGRLGQGGMGTVYLGRGPDSTVVAIKVIKPELAERPEFRARFRREAESARRVRRFTTAAVLDADPDGPLPYLVTEYVEGPTLSRLVSRRGPLRPADLEQLALSVATALAAIHAAGIVHRDLTPANVLLSPVGPKVIDFGLARDFAGSGEFSRTTKNAIGTPGYMAPEQILDAPVTSAADVFAWGAITVYAATGRAPFGEGRIEALLYRILYEPANIEGVPAELAALVDAALQKDPARRPTAEALRAALMSGGAVELTTTPAPVAPTSDDPAAREGRSRRRGLFGRAGRAEQAAAAAAVLSTPPPALSGPATTASAPGTAGPTSPLPAAGARPVPPPAQPVPVSPPPAPRSPVPGPATAHPAPAAAPVTTAGGPAPVMPTGAGPDAPGPGGGSRGGRRTRALVIAGIVVLAAAAVAVPLALTHRSTGASDGGSTPPSAQRLTALSTQLAQLAETSRPTDPAKAARLSLAAFRLAPTAVATHAMIASFTVDSWVRLPGPTATYTGAALSADGKLAAATDTAGHLRLWDLASTDNPELSADVNAGTADLTGARVLPTGGLVTGGSVGHTWTLAGARDGHSLATITGQAAPMRLALSGDGKLLATAGVDRAVELWDVSDPSHPRSLRFLFEPGIVTDVALSPDGKALAVAGVSGTVDLWDIADPRSPVHRANATGHVGPVNAVTFLAGGAVLATGGDDTTVRLWNVSDPAHPTQIASLAGHHSAVLDLVVAGTGWLVSSDNDGEMLGWDLGDAAPATLTAGGSGPAPAVLANGATRRDLAADGTGRMLLTAPASGPGGTPAIGSTDPTRLVAVACRNPANQISQTEWDALAPDVPYTRPCAG